MLRALVFVTLLCAAGPATAESYLFYLHGHIVEGSDGRPAHPEYGVYDYPAIVAAFEEEGFTVISEIRPAGTDGLAYAGRVAAQVDSLIGLGVPAEDISVVGMSKGGGIALATSVQLANADVNFVLMGTCYGQPQDMPPMLMRGRVLLIHEDSDVVTRRCSDRRPPADEGLEFRRLRTRTDRGHGAFFRPDPAWLAPTVAWCLRSDERTAGEVQAMYRDYRGDFRGAAEVGPAQLTDWLSSDRVVLVDVRREEEREWSWIPGSITREEFEQGDFGGRRVVAYCTIGYRSGKYAEHLRKQRIDAYNLEAGILGWVHDFRPVERDGVETRDVHVYGRQWSLVPSWYRAIW